MGVGWERVELIGGGNILTDVQCAIAGWHVSGPRRFVRGKKHHKPSYSCKIYDPRIALLYAKCIHWRRRWRSGVLRSNHFVGMLNTCTNSVTGSGSKMMAYYELLIPMKRRLSRNRECWQCPSGLSGWAVCKMIFIVWASAKILSAYFILQVSRESVKWIANLLNCDLAKTEADAWRHLRILDKWAKRIFSPKHIAGDWLRDPST